jgi:hypothetical protein
MDEALFDGDDGDGWRTLPSHEQGTVAHVDNYMTWLDHFRDYLVGIGFTPFKLELFTHIKCDRELGGPDHGAWIWHEPTSGKGQVADPQACRIIEERRRCSACEIDKRGTMSLKLRHGRTSKRRDLRCLLGSPITRFPVFCDICRSFAIDRGLFSPHLTNNHSWREAARDQGKLKHPCNTTQY